MAKDTGGPAFPTENEHQSGSSTMHYEGMTLRDWFAGQALSGLLAKYILNAPGDQNTLAQMSYELANAMLAERSKE